MRFKKLLMAIATTALSLTSIVRADQACENRVHLEAHNRYREALTTVQRFINGALQNQVRALRRLDRALYLLPESRQEIDDTARHNTELSSELDHWIQAQLNDAQNNFNSAQCPPTTRAAFNANTWMLTAANTNLGWTCEDTSGYPGPSLNDPGFNDPALSQSIVMQRGLVTITLPENLRLPLIIYACNRYRTTTPANGEAPQVSITLCSTMDLVTGQISGAQDRISLHHGVRSRRAGRIEPLSVSAADERLHQAEVNGVSVVQSEERYVDSQTQDRCQ